jgi:hypothetical protein
MPDFTVTYHSSMVQFLPLTEAAEAWCKANIDAGTWQYDPSGGFAVEHRYAQQIIEGLQAEGLNFE